MSAATNAAPAPAAPWYDAAPLRPADAVRELGPTLVVAPHPDDEALGCGGTIALLRQADIPVRVVIASDGGASHPGSRRFPPPALAALRRRESLAGLQHLGVAPDEITFLGLPDGAVPRASAADAPTSGTNAPDGANAPNAVELACAALRAFPDAQTVLLPWRRDPHDDHRATWSLFTAALDTLASTVRRLEYPIWSLVHPGPDDLPRPGEARLWRLEVTSTVEQKRAAILAHRSQTTPMIDDAEIGYCLTDAVLAPFFQPWELTIEAER